MDGTITRFGGKTMDSEGYDFLGLITGSEGLTFAHHSGGKYRANISYDNLGVYSRSYPFTITATATDNSGQSTSISKTWSKYFTTC